MALFFGDLSQSENLSEIKLLLILVNKKNLYDFLKTKAERPSFYYDIHKCNRVHVGLEFQVWACKLKYVQIIITLGHHL